MSDKSASRVADRAVDVAVQSRSRWRQPSLLVKLWFAYGILVAGGGVAVLASRIMDRAEIAARLIPVVTWNAAAEEPAASAYLGMPPQIPVAEGSWTVVPAFPRIILHNPVFVTAAPRTGLLFAGEREGRIVAFENDPEATSTITFLDIRSRCQGWSDCGLLGLAFHPDFGRADSPNRGYLFVAYQYSEHPTAGPERPHPDRLSSNRLSRFTVPDGAQAADPDSELVLIDQEDRNLWHNGGALLFGPDDGFLYLSLGDEGGGGNPFDNAQHIDRDLFAGILRIDLDCDPSRSHPPPRQPLRGKTSHYFIPDDNPFVGCPGALEEFWCVGLRSPHRMTCDRSTGTIWVGDVGDAGANSREEINLIRKGGNYEWDYREGTASRKPPPAVLLGESQPPLFEYRRGGGNCCVIGGYVYRGREHAAELVGKYIFGDNGSGRIWALQIEDDKPPVVTELCTLTAKHRNRSGLSSFGVDNHDELYLCLLGTPERPAGGIFRLGHAGPPGPPVPRLLSATGAFRDTPSLSPAAGLLPYEVNTSLWADGAEKRRWMSLPRDPTTGQRQPITVRENASWSFPAGTVFVKHFELPGFGPGGGSRRLETRVLVCDPHDSVYGVTYKWRPDQTDADLVEQGVSEEIVSADARHRQVWYFPGSVDCLTCHNASAGFVLGLQDKQINREIRCSEGGPPQNQLRCWNDRRLFEPVFTEATLSSIPRMAAVDDAGASLDHRVRSYLEVNCGTCHRPNQAQTLFDARMDAPNDDRHIINGAVVSVSAEKEMRVVAPGDPAHSLLLRRMSSEGELRMPPVARHEPDRAALALFAQWIEQIPRNWNSDAPAPEPPPRWYLRRHTFAAAVALVAVLLTAVTFYARRAPRGNIGTDTECRSQSAHWKADSRDRPVPHQCQNSRSRTSRGGPAAPA
jgi:uncharacterized repeat protein (TIGR03806 family)